MALNYDVAFKFGCGRYIQERDAITKNLCTELKRFGKKVLFVCGENGYRVAFEKIRKALDETDIEYEVKQFHGTPCFENADVFAQYAKDNGFDILCGVGGGVIADTVKLAAQNADTALVQIPTSSATCASVTPLSVMFDKDTHAYLGSFLCEKEADAVIVDMDIMIEQPARLFWAGVIDAMAKKIEITHYMGCPKDEIPFGLNMAYALAEQVYDFYVDNYDELSNAILTNTITKKIELAVFYAVAVPGIVSGLSKGSKQTALAHHFYEEARTCFYPETKEFLHGELVGVGLIAQLQYTHHDYTAMALRLKDMKLPTCFSELNIPPTKENASVFAKRLCASKAVNDQSEAAMQKVMQAMSVICK